MEYLVEFNYVVWSEGQLAWIEELCGPCFDGWLTKPHEYFWHYKIHPNNQGWLVWFKNPDHALIVKMRWA